MKIAVGNSRMDKKWKNRDISWENLCQRVSSTIRTTETVEEYRKLKKGAQDNIKDVGGFVGGTLRGGSRKRGCCTIRNSGCELTHLLFASVSGCKDTRQACFCILTRQIIPVLYRNGFLKRSTLWGLTDCDEQTVHIQPLRLLGFEIQKLHTLQDIPKPKKLLYRIVPKDPDILLPLRTANQMGACAEGLTPVNQRDAAAGVCQKQRVLQRRIAAAHDSYIRAFIKCAVADCAIGYAAADKRHFPRKTQLSVRRASRKNHRFCLSNAVCAADPEARRRFLKPHRLCIDDLRAECARLFGHLPGKFCAGNRRNARIVFHQRRGDDLSAGRFPLQNRDSFSCPGGINCRRQTSRATANDQNLIHLRSPLRQ